MSQGWTRLPVRERDAADGLAATIAQLVDHVQEALYGWGQGGGEGGGTGQPAVQCLDHAVHCNLWVRSKVWVKSEKPRLRTDENPDHMPSKGLRALDWTGGNRTTTSRLTWVIIGTLMRQRGEEGGHGGPAGLHGTRRSMYPVPHQGSWAAGHTRSRLPANLAGTLALHSVTHSLSLLAVTHLIDHCAQHGKDGGHDRIRPENGPGPYLDGAAPRADGCAALHHVLGARRLRSAAGSHFRIRRERGRAECHSRTDERESLGPSSAWWVQALRVHLRPFRRIPPARARFFVHTSGVTPMSHRAAMIGHRRRRAVQRCPDSSSIFSCCWTKQPPLP